MFEAYKSDAWASKIRRYAFWGFLTALVLKVMYLAIALGFRDGPLVGFRAFIRLSIFGPLLAVGARLLWKGIERLPYSFRIWASAVAGGFTFFLAIGFLVLLVMPVPDPQIVPDTVVKRIETMPEFERIGSNLQVSGTKRRGGDSSGYYIYTANVSFIPQGSSGAVNGEADFTWRQGHWHIGSLIYREAGEHKIIRFATD